ncbi:hypothetical protein RYX36_024395 [Vicia faba]
MNSTITHRGCKTWNAGSKTEVEKATQEKTQVTQEQTQASQATHPTEAATQEQPEANASQTDADYEFELLTVNLASVFEANHTKPNLPTTTQTQPNLVVNSITIVYIAPSASSQSVPATSTQSAPVPSGITLYALGYILFSPVPTIDEVPAPPSYANPICLKPVKFIKTFAYDLELF